MNDIANLSPERRKEISDYMTANLWVAEVNPKSGMWTMSKEPYPYSYGPFEVLAIGISLEDAFDKARKQAVPA